MAASNGLRRAWAATMRHAVLVVVTTGLHTPSYAEPPAAPTSEPTTLPATDLVGQDVHETQKTDFAVSDGTIIELQTGGVTGEDAFGDVVLVGDDDSYWCSGVLIDARRVLTAAHCSAATRVAFGNDVSTSTPVLVVGRIVHPSLDVSILRLKNKAKIRPHTRRRHQDSAPPIGAIRMLGFGVRDPLRLTGFGTKRRLDVVVDGWGCTSPRANVTGCRMGDELLVRGGQGNDTCLGDSGGPVFEIVDDTWRLLAITSRGMRPRKVICGEGGIYVRLDRLDTWLEENK
jgi:hypothetical protein